MQNNESAKELSCYRDIGHELEKEFTASQQQEIAEHKQKEDAELAMQLAFNQPEKICNTLTSNSRLETK
jgi:hypothetical protein